MIRELGYAIAAASAVVGALSRLLAGLGQLMAPSIGFVLLGVTMVAVGDAPRPLPEALRSLVEGAALNAETILEAADAKGMAVVLPPREYGVPVFVPREANADYLRLARELAEAPLAAFDALGVKGATIMLPPVKASSSAYLDDVVREAVVEDLELAEHSTVTQAGEDRITVEVVSPRGPSLPRLQASLGPLPIAVALSAIATALRRPLVVERSYGTARGWAVDLRVVGRGDSHGQE